MKLVRHGNPGLERPGLIDAHGTIRDLGEHVEDIDPASLAPAELDRIRSIAPETLAPVAPSTRLGPCVGKVPKLVCVGLNYADHAREAGMPLPEEPVLFMKATSSICGAFDDITLPRASRKTDWEVELGVVVGTSARYVEESDALTHVAGYCVANDLSEREFQLERGGQWVKGKSADTFGPIGPWLVTADEVPDPQALDLWLSVDGYRHQQGSTRTMVFGVAFLVSYISRFMTLQAGDVIFTGTPPGVGLGQTPPRFLAGGEIVTAGIEGLGEQRQRVVRGS